jgi:IS1 family transposase
MNKLSFEKRCHILRLLVEGNSLRSCSRIVDVSINTVTKLLIDAGKVCLQFHNDMVTNVNSKRVQVDEIWSFVYSKEKNVPEQKRGFNKKKAGDVWTWVAIDAETKLVISWLVGNRDAWAAKALMADLKSRLIETQIQISSDGFRAYEEGVVSAFGTQVDFGQLIKIYGKDRIPDFGEKSRYGRYQGAEKHVIMGNPETKYISTCYVERQNLTMRMCMRRFTRDTNAFSKKVENHCYAIALHFVYYNFIRCHKTLRIPPAMEAGLIKKLMKIEDIVRLI